MPERPPIVGDHGSRSYAELMDRSRRLARFLGDRGLGARLGMPGNGKTTTVVNTQSYRVEAVLDTGPRTNHPNFVTVDGVDYAYVTVGDLHQTLVYRRLTNGGPPTLVKRIDNHGAGSHGIWPSPDNTRIYVALQYSDAVDVIDTKTMEVINTLRVGQSPMALVYVARTSAGGNAGLGRQGLGMRIENRPVEVQGVPGAGNAQLRALPGIGEVVIDVRGLPPNRSFTVYATRGEETTALLTATSNNMGVYPRRSPSSPSSPTTTRRSSGVPPPPEGCLS